MPFDPIAHNTRMVARFLWLESLDPSYATHALDQYRKDPNSPNPNILADVKAEKTRRAKEQSNASSQL